ncbi:MAG: E3 ubiquitin-protein ligase sspH2 [Candidatus Anoxychlamydiales bacterium]|nr:E3 ubiquitin-protein ligase sspH2 [Candidatus Anoxychlamydiales bacterium]
MTSSISKSSTLPFGNLPNEMIMKVFSHLDIPELASTSLASKHFQGLANDWATWSSVIDKIGLKNLEDKDVSEKKQKIKKIHELGKLYFPEVIEEPITIENTIETIRRIHEIKIRDTLKIWEKIYEQAEHIAGKPDIEIPKFDELKKSTDKKYIKQVFAKWINNNKDNFNLTELDLRISGLLYLPKEIGNLSNLQVLKLSRNNLTSIPKKIGNLAQLQLLDLSDNKLTSVPKEIGNLSNLQVLYLARNKLTSVPKEIGALAQLKRLYLSDNKLTSIPKAIEKLVQLQYLYLYNNNLASIPKAIEKLTQLKELCLSNNKLSSIPNEIGSLSQLQTLDLNNNNLTSIPKEIGDLALLEELRLYNNPITYYPECLDRLTNTNIFVKNHILIVHEIIRFLGGHIAHHLYNKIYGPITE